jgi:hypothetical protein
MACDVERKSWWKDGKYPAAGGRGHRGAHLPLGEKSAVVSRAGRMEGCKRAEYWLHRLNALHGRGTKELDPI